MRLSPVVAILLSGGLWLVAGLMLLIKGLNLVTLALYAEKFGVASALIPHLARLTGSSETGAVVLIAIGLLIGLFKGRFVLIKSVRRVVHRILSLPAPLKIGQIYSWSYLALIGGMILLGISLRFIGLSPDIHGMIDVAIGSALINGAMIYFRCAFIARQPKNS